MTTPPTPNLFQRFFIPQESYLVRLCMIQASDWSERKDSFLLSRVASVLIATLAVILSAFNALSYLLEIPIKFVLNIVTFNYWIFVDFGKGWANVARSVAFAFIGYAYVGTGVFIPHKVFPYFKPHVDENELLNAYKNQVIALTAEKQVLKGKLEKAETEHKDLLSRLAAGESVVEVKQNQPTKPRERAASF